MSFHRHRARTDSFTQQPIRVDFADYLRFCHGHKVKTVCVHSVPFPLSCPDQTTRDIHRRLARTPSPQSRHRPTSAPPSIRCNLVRPLRLPTEVYEHMIDFLDPYWVEDRHALLACCLTSRAWLHRSRCRLFLSVQFSEPAQLSHFSKAIIAQPCLSDGVQKLTIELDQGNPLSTPSRLFLTFPYMLARRVKNLKCLLIQWGRAPPFLHSFPMALSEFESITRLELNRVQFPSLIAFGRLVCALRSLSDLICLEVTWMQNGSDTSIPKRCWHRPSLTRLHLLKTCCSDGILALLFATATSVAKLETVSLPTIKMGEMTLLGEHMKAVGTSLRHLMIGYGEDSNTAPKEEVVKSLYLAFNTKLISIYLYARSGGDYMSWILSQITSPHIALVTIFIWSDVQESDLDQLRCDQIDEILSHPQFSNVTKLSFEYDNGLTTRAGWLRWLRSELRCRLPRAYKRNLIEFKPKTREWWRF